jgi:sRNA-binding carbon storage regulator CsrA
LSADFLAFRSTTDTRLKEIKRTVEQVSIKTPYDFEVYREELNDIIDSFNNANYYEYSMEGIALILEVFKRLKSGGK